MRTEWDGLLRRPGEVGAGVETSMTLDASAIALRLGDSHLGTWERADVEFRPWETIAMTLDGETWLFTPRRAKDFVASISMTRDADVTSGQAERSGPLVDPKVISSVFAVGALAVVLAGVMGGAASAALGFAGGVAMVVVARSVFPQKSDSEATPRRSPRRRSDHLDRSEDQFIQVVGALIGRGTSRSPSDDAPTAAKSDENTQEIDLRLETIDEDDPRNLTRIYGIGEHYSRMLWRMGIYTVIDLANADDETLCAIEEALGEQRERLHRDDWVGQARKLVRVLSTIEQSSQPLDLPSKAV